MTSTLPKNKREERFLLKGAFAVVESSRMPYEANKDPVPKMPMRGTSAVLDLQTFMFLILNVKSLALR